MSSSSSTAVNVTSSGAILICVAGLFNSAVGSYLVWAGTILMLIGGAMLIASWTKGSKS